MKEHYTTERLSLEPLQTEHAAFIQALVNTPEWLQFIGQRNVHSEDGAIAYITGILLNPSVHYWVVKSKTENKPVGVITFIKRAYLDHHDLGFAFLPETFGNGFAFEAAATVLNDLLHEQPRMLATTVPENERSVRLLEKLGFQFDREIENEGDRLLVFFIDGKTS